MSVIPEHIGPYRVLRPLARGGFAEVFEVEDPASGQHLALKLLVNSRVALKRFNREYEAMARLNHSGVVRVYHYGLHYGQPWLTMELLQGATVEQWLRGFGPPGALERDDEVLRLGFFLSRALHYVHDRGLVHRDLKSANVMVLPDGRVKLVDFGTAYLSDAAERITSEGEFVGTFAYASPEQMQGVAITYKSDLYSLGVLLYRLAVGRRPFNAREPAELAWQHINEEPPDPRGYVPSLAAPLVELILQLLAKAPSDRPANAGLVAAALERLAGRPLSSRSQVALHRSRSTSRIPEQHEIWERLGRGRPGDLVLLLGEAGSDRVRVLSDVDSGAKDKGWTAISAMMRPHRDVTCLVRLFVNLGKGLEDHAEVIEAVQTLRSSSRLEMRSQPKARVAIRVAAADLVAARSKADGRPVVIILQEVHGTGVIGLELIAGVRKELQRRHIRALFLVGAVSSAVRRSSLLIRFLETETPVVLQPLSPSALANAPGLMLGRRPPPADVCRHIHRYTGGHPLYIEEAIAWAVLTGEVEAEGNQLEWANAKGIAGPPASAMADAEGILQGLPVAHGRLLQVMEVVPKADLGILAAVMGWKIQEVIPLVSDLTRRGVVRWHPVDQPDPVWSHPAVHRVVRGVVSPVRRSLWQIRAAQAVAGRKSSEVQVAALTRVGRLAEASLAAVVICRELVEQRKVRTAHSVLQTLVQELIHLKSGRTQAMAEVFLLYSLCLQAVQPADPDTAKTLGLASQINDLSPALTARISWGQATLLRAIGHYKSYAKGVATALRVLPRGAEPELRGWMLMEKGDSLRFRGANAMADNAYVEAETIARAHRKMRLLAHATVGSGACWVNQGQLEEGERQLSRAMAQLQRMGDVQGFWMALAQWGEAVRRQGRYSEALSVLYQRAPEARHHEDPSAYHRLLLSIAWCEIDLERLGRAQECVDEMAASLGRGEHLHLRLQRRLLQGRIMLSSGQPREAAYHFQEVADKARLADLMVLAEQGRSLLAESHWMTGDRVGAADLY
ncbi:MAG: protein kinase [Rhodobacterales bacterium]|nr:protein kinase [Rhodobacterales bacterium]